MVKLKKLDEIVAEMRLVGEQLVPYNYPNADRSLENEMALVKTQEAVVDGYPIILHYGKHDYRTHLTETVQIFGKHVPFLPFNLVTKVARKFLGSNHLTEIEILKDNQKMYCWTVTVDKNGKAIPSPYVKDAQIMKHENLEFAYLDPSQFHVY